MFAFAIPVLVGASSPTGSTLSSRRPWSMWKPRCARPHLPNICAQREAVPSVQPRTAESVIQDFWRLCAAGEYTKTLPLFSKTAVYYDTLYPNPFVGEEAIAKHLSNMESAIPGGLVSVELDEIAAGTEKVGARWHLETKDGSPVQFTRGASMYTIIEEDAELRIAEAWDFVETPFKVAGIILPVLRGAATILKAFENLKAP